MRASAPFFRASAKRGLKLVRAFHLQRLKAHAQRPGRGLGRSQLALAVARGMPEDSDARDPGDGLFQEFHPLPAQVLREGRQPRDVPAWSGEARDETGPHRVARERHDDGDCGGGLLAPQRPVSACDDDVHLEANQVGGQAWEPFGSSLRPSVFDAEVPPLDVAELAKPLPERLERGDAGGEPRLRLPMRYTFPAGCASAASGRARRPQAARMSESTRNRMVVFLPSAAEGRPPDPTKPPPWTPGGCKKVHSRRCVAPGVNRSRNKAVRRSER